MHQLKVLFLSTGVVGHAKDVPCRVVPGSGGSVPCQIFPCRALRIRAVPNISVPCHAWPCQDLGTKILVPRSWYQDPGTARHGNIWHGTDHKGTARKCLARHGSTRPWDGTARDIPANMTYILTQLDSRKAYLLALVKNERNKILELYVIQELGKFASFLPVKIKMIKQ